MVTGYYCYLVLEKIAADGNGERGNEGGRVVVTAGCEGRIEQ